MTNIDSANDLTQARLGALFELSEWQKLLIHFDLAPDSFAFIPFFVPDSSWAELCRNSLADFLRDAEKKQLFVINLKTPEELKNLASIFFDLKTNEITGAVWISAPIPFQKDELKEWKEAWREGMARLNQYRNPFREKFDVPVLLVGAEWTKEIMRNMAPDLWSVITISVRIEPPDISIGDTDKIEFAATSNQFEGWRGVDPYFALKEAERLRGKQGKELGLARLLYRAANGFDARAKYRESLQFSTEAAEITQQLISESNGKIDSEIKLLLVDVLNTKGIALWRQGRLAEAIAEYDKAIEIYERLINKENRGELANELAKTYMNKGGAFVDSDRFDESIGEYSKAIAIYEQLVNQEKREELENDLAMTYWGKGNALASLGKLTEAIDRYDEAINIWEKCLQRNEHYILPNLFTVLYLRVRDLSKMKNWNLIAKDIHRVFNLRDEVFEYPDLSEYFKLQISKSCNDVIQLIREISAEKREKIYKHAGENGDMIRRLVDNFEEKAKSS